MNNAIAENLRRLAEDHYEMLNDIHRPLLEAAAEIDSLEDELDDYQDASLADAALLDAMELEISELQFALRRVQKRLLQTDSIERRIGDIHDIIDTALRRKLGVTSD